MCHPPSSVFVCHRFPRRPSPLVPCFRFCLCTPHSCQVRSTTLTSKLFDTNSLLILLCLFPLPSTMSSTLSTEKPPSASASLHTSDASTTDIEKPVVGPPAITFPEGGVRAWLTVAGGSMIFMCSFGIVQSFGVFQDYYTVSILLPYAPQSLRTHTVHSVWRSPSTARRKSAGSAPSSSSCCSSSVSLPVVSTTWATSAG